MRKGSPMPVHDGSPNPNVSSAEPPSRRDEYHAPVLTELGALAELTRGNSTAVTDNPMIGSR